MMQLKISGKTLNKNNQESKPTKGKENAWSNIEHGNQLYRSLVMPKKKKMNKCYAK